MLALQHLICLLFQFSVRLFPAAAAASSTSSFSSPLRCRHRCCCCCWWWFSLYFMCSIGEQLFCVIAFMSSTCSSFHSISSLHVRLPPSPLFFFVQTHQMYVYHTHTQSTRITKEDFYEAFNYRICRFESIVWCRCMRMSYSCEIVASLENHRCGNNGVCIECSRWQPMADKNKMKMPIVSAKHFEY